MTALCNELDLELREHTAVLTLNHPPANSWTLAMLNAVPPLMAELNKEPALHTLILTGAGSRFFCAGADLHQFAGAQPEVASEVTLAFGQAFAALTAFRGVVIAAINGFALGGGLEAALACDLRIAESHAQLGLPEASVGLLPCAGGTQLLPWLVGEGWAKRIILCGERLDAETAAAIGLLEAVVARGESLDQALFWAQQISAQSPDSVRACKRLIQSARNLPLEDGLERERQRFVALFGTANQREGVEAFLQKRPPRWQDS